MTIVRAVAVLCPSCREWRKSPVTTSTTIFNLRQWSDGYAMSLLAGAFDNRLRVCACGAIFVVHKTERREITRDFVPVGIVCAVALHEAEFFVVERAPYERDIELPLRKLVWWHSNKDQRGIATSQNELARPVTYRPDWMPQPAACVRFSPADHRSNLGRIVELLLGEADPNWMLVGDASRQLGEYGEAIAAYEQMPSSLAGWQRHLIKHARRGWDEVVELSNVRQEAFARGFLGIFNRPGAVE